MAKKKTTKVTKAKLCVPCTTEESCNCKGILALVIIVLAWWKPTVMWSQITITVMAAIILLSENSCFCKK